MVEGIVAFLTAFVGLVMYLLKKRDESAPQRAEQQEEHTTDANLVNSDPTDLSLELDRLYTKSGGPAGQPHTPTGDFMQQDQRKPE